MLGSTAVVTGWISRLDHSEYFLGCVCEFPFSEHAHSISTQSALNHMIVCDHCRPTTQTADLCSFPVQECLWENQPKEFWGSWCRTAPSNFRGSGKGTAWYGTLQDWESSPILCIQRKSIDSVRGWQQQMKYWPKCLQTEFFFFHPNNQKKNFVSFNSTGDRNVHTWFGHQFLAHRPCRGNIFLWRSVGRNVCRGSRWLRCTNASKSQMVLSKSQKRIRKRKYHKGHNW